MTTAHAILLGIGVARLRRRVGAVRAAGGPHPRDRPARAGSGNIGATNVGRLLGGRFFAIVFVLDLLKGLVPMLGAGAVLGAWQHGYALHLSAIDYLLWLLVGFCAIVGHLFSVFLRFKGGKGVATSTGVILGLFPYYTLPGLLAAGTWLVVFRLMRYVSVASMVGAVSFVIAYACAVPAPGLAADAQPVAAAGVRRPDGGADRLQASRQPRPPPRRDRAPLRLFWRAAARIEWALAFPRIMKRNTQAVGLVLLGLVAVGVYSIWLRPEPGTVVDFPAALIQSQKSGKPVLVDFWATWCGPCQEMRRTTWKDPRVRKAMDDYVFLEVDVDRNQKLASQYEVSGIPHLVLLDAKGQVIKMSEGFMSADQLLAWLHASRDSTASVRLLDPER